MNLTDFQQNIVNMFPTLNWTHANDGLRLSHVENGQFQFYFCLMDNVEHEAYINNENGGYWMPVEEAVKIIKMKTKLKNFK